MSDGNKSSASEAAERVRLKRLAKLGTPSPSPGTAPSSSPAVPVLPGPAPKPNPQPVVKSPPPAPVASTSAPVRKVPAGPVKLDIPAWEHETIGHVLNVTLDREYAEQHQWKPVWLKYVQEELDSEHSGSQRPRRLTTELADRLLIARLEVNSETMLEDMDYLPALASLPTDETIFEYLIGCWRRQNTIRTSLLKKIYTPQDTQQAMTVLDKLKDLVISYAGLDLQDPEMFTQTRTKLTGPPELVSSLLSLSSLTDPLSSSSSATTLSATEVPNFLQDLVQRFEPEGELESILGSTIKNLLFHASLARPEGLGGVDASWRGIVSGLEALVSIKPIAIMITKMHEWNPPSATAPTFELTSLMGPLLRLNVFPREWPIIANTYFSEPDKRSHVDIESSNASFRGTLKSLQSSLFQVFNALVRASPESREAVLQYFSRVVSLNVKRGGMQVDPATVASDSFMINVQTILLRFAEPFMDAQYSKIDRIDLNYLGRSASRVDVREETRIKATSDEVNEWAKEVEAAGGPAPNFISDIFYLTGAVNHYGLNRTVQTFDELFKQADELQRHVDLLTSSMAPLRPGDPFMLRIQAGIDAAKGGISKVHMERLAYKVQLLDPEFIFRQIGLTNFVETWLIRLVDPKKSHPKPTVDIPLPKDIPVVFRMLPEYFLEDVVDFLLFLMRNSPMSLDLTGRNELVIWALTFLRSSWYIKNPFLKAKINEVIFYGTLGYGRQSGVLTGILNTHPFALKHLMPALMSFYIEVEQTGASSQFYDKFNARRNIAYILKAVWNNPTHRKALNNESKDMDKFVRFVNLMINDVTYLMDESLSELSQIATIQHEMDSPEWQTKSAEYRHEREGSLRSLERHASGYTTLGRSTVDMLKIFTAETKAPFMVPEIVDRLAAMLDYNLDALVGPRCSDLKVKDREKYRFEPRKLLSDILDIYLNLSDQPEFVRAVANDGRSYRKELFESAARIAHNKTLKTDDEIEKLRLFVLKVEEAKATLEIEDDLGEVPDEFLDPLMFTVMRDPVTLPSSNVNIDRSTIKSHLLSDSKDPFNRAPLSLEDVVPNPELKAQIDAFLAERRNKSTALDVPEKDVVNMDVSE